MQSRKAMEINKNLSMKTNYKKKEVIIFKVGTSCRPFTIFLD